jgi:hypothetical protein
LRQDFWRAGHAHAGVWLILALVALRYVDEAKLSDTMKWLVRGSIPIAAILVPSAFFLSVLSPHATAPSGVILLAYVGARATVGSGNLTFGGWGYNTEVVDVPTRCAGQRAERSLRVSTRGTEHRAFVRSRPSEPAHPPAEHPRSAGRRPRTTAARAPSAGVARRRSVRRFGKGAGRAPLLGKGRPPGGPCPARRGYAGARSGLP